MIPASDPDNDLLAFACAIGALTHRFNNALTTVMGLAEWHLIAETHAAPLRSDLEKIRAAAVLAQQTSQEIQRLVHEAANRSGRAGIDSSSEAARPRAVTDERAPAPQSPVLLVDDQIDVRNSLSVMVRTIGYPVHAVDGGEAALAWLADHPAAAVLTDFGMPGMDGEALARALAERHPHLPVVLLTGWSLGTRTPPGVRRVLPKPLRMAQLRECLETVVGPVAA
jgi:CheY-like chemotaxis protein